VCPAWTGWKAGRSRTGPPGRWTPGWASPDRLLREAREAGTELLGQERRLHELCVEPEPAKEIMLAGGGAELNRRAAELWNAAAAREMSARSRGAAYHGGAWLLYAAGLATALVVVGDLMAADGGYAELYRLQERAYR
jgi:hypothetical protein